MRKRWLVNEKGNTKNWLHGICGSVQLRMSLYLKNVYRFGSAVTFVDANNLADAYPVRFAVLDNSEFSDRH